MPLLLIINPIQNKQNQINYLYDIHKCVFFKQINFANLIKILLY